MLLLERAAGFAKEGLPQAGSRDRRSVAEQRLEPASGVANALAWTQSQVSASPKSRQGNQSYEEVVIRVWGAVEVK